MKHSQASGESILTFDPLLEQEPFCSIDKVQIIPDGISPETEPGEYVVIAEKSGCGKSALLRLLTVFCNVPLFVFRLWRQ